MSPQSVIQRNRETIENMNGNWQYIYSNSEGMHQLRISIAPDICNYIHELNGIEIERIEFSRIAHWFGPWLCFSNAPHNFYIQTANSETMVFGTQEGSTIGNYNWQYSFSRLN